MPTIAWFFGVSIRMYFNDHAPAHFHAFVDADEARIDIVSGDALSGRLPPAQRRLVKEWALANQAALLQNWDKARRGEPLERIPGHAND